MTPCPSDAVFWWHLCQLPKKFTAKFEDPSRSKAPQLHPQTEFEDSSSSKALQLHPQTQFEDSSHRKAQHYILKPNLRTQVAAKRSITSSNRIWRLKPQQSAASHPQISNAQPYLSQISLSQIDSKDIAAYQIGRDVLWIYLKAKVIPSDLINKL